MVRMMIAALVLLATMALPSVAARANAMQSSATSLAMDFLSALGRLDFEGAGLLLDEDAVLDLPYAGDGMTLHGRAAILDFFRKTMGSSVAGIEYRLGRAYPSPEAGAVVIEITTRGRTAAGREYTNLLVGIFEIRDGRIALFREYFNPARLN